MYLEVMPRTRLHPPSAGQYGGEVDPPPPFAVQLVGGEPAETSRTGR